jgi:hypothetical protein
MGYAQVSGGQGDKTAGAARGMITFATRTSMPVAKLHFLGHLRMRTAAVVIVRLVLYTGQKQRAEMAATSGGRFEVRAVGVMAEDFGVLALGAFAEAIDAQKARALLQG